MRQKQVTKPVPPVIGGAVLIIIMLLAWASAAIGSIAPISFIYDGI